jgi:hypothetical protein
MVGWLTRPAAGLLLAVGLALLPLSLPLSRELAHALGVRLRQMRGAGWGTWALVSLFAVQAALHVLADLAPPVEGDTVNSYLLVPRYWVEARRYWQPDHIWASTLPGHMMMLSAWGLLLRGSSPEALLRGYSLATLLSGCLMSLFLAVSVYALARVRFGGRVGLLAASLIFLMPDASYLAESGKVDLGWAFFETLALGALLRWSSDQAPSARWLALAGACSGLALGAKSEAVLSLPFLAGWIVVVGLRRDTPSATGRGLLIFGALALAVGAPYLAYNAVAHHNPTYPVFASLFARTLGGTPAARGELGTEVFYAWTPLGYLLNLWDASLGHLPPFYLGFWAGPAFLILVPLGLLLGKRERLTDGLLLYTFAFSIAWFLVKQAVRHFLPGLVLLAVVSAYALRRMDEEPQWLSHVVYATLAACLALGVALWAGIVYSNGAYRPALGIQSPEAYLAHWADEVADDPTFPDSAAIAYVNTHLQAGERILTQHAQLALYYRADLLTTSHRQPTNIWATRDEAALLDALDANGVGYLLIFKSDLAGDNADLPLYSRPAFYERHTELLLETPRATLYRLRDAG